MNQFASSELILNEDGSVYHLNLLPEQISDIIFLVGDPGRVPRISRHFDKIDHRSEKREFVTHTGWFRGTRFSVVSTGIGTDNIDIVLNELDALANIDLKSRTVKKDISSLTFIRLGTSGALRASTDPGDIVVSSHGLGMDGLMHYYQRDLDKEGLKLGESFIEFCDMENISLPLKPYGATGSKELREKYFSDKTAGITMTATGFYGPQSRQLRAPISSPDFFNNIRSFDFEDHMITNMEMETAAIYGLSNELGHQALSVNAILANRVNGVFAKDPAGVVNNMIAEVLERLSA